LNALAKAKIKDMKGLSSIPVHVIGDREENMAHKSSPSKYDDHDLVKVDGTSRRNSMSYQASKKKNLALRKNKYLPSKGDDPVDQDSKFVKKHVNGLHLQVYPDDSNMPATDQPAAGVSEETSARGTGVWDASWSPRVRPESWERELVEISSRMHPRPRKGSRQWEGSCTTDDCMIQ